MQDFVVDFYKTTNVLDIVYLVITIFTLIGCYKRGFVLSILSMAKWFLAYIITLIIFPKAKPYLKGIIFLEDVNINNGPTAIYPKSVTNKFINEKLDDLIKSTGRCHIISDPFQTMASSYLNEVSLVVAISIYLPSVILECAANGARSIFYDTSNMQKYESDIFKWGKDKVIFNDLKKMIRDIKIFKNQPTIKSDLGIWSDDNFKLNTFDDNIGSKRIGEYLKFLIDGFNDNKDANEIVKKANSHYAENWGAHSIYKITDIKYK